MLQKLLFMIKSSVAIITVVLHNRQTRNVTRRVNWLEHVHTLVRIYQRDSHWADFNEI